MNEKLASGLSARRVEYIHAVLRSALNVAVRDSLVARNVAASVRPPRVQTEEVRPLSPEEARHFLNTICGHRLAALFTVALSLGLRLGEALGLRWRDIDLETGALRVRCALQRLAPTATTDVGRRAKRAFHLVEPKTPKSRRTVALPQVTVAALLKHKTRQSEERKLAASAWKAPILVVDGEPVAVEDLVFVSRVGNPYHESSIDHLFQSLLKLAGIERRRCHDLRHTATTLLQVQGVHPGAIQRALGWENMAMLNRYSHFVEESRRAVATAMDAILAPVAVNVAVKAQAAKPN